MKICYPDFYFFTFNLFHFVKISLNLCFQMRQMQRHIFMVIKNQYLRLNFFIRSKYTFFLALLFVSTTGCFNKQEKPTSYQIATQEEINKEDKHNLNDVIADFESKERLAWQKPEFIINLFGEIGNKVVADLGAGTGFFSFRLVRTAKKVIALDIDKRFLSFMDSLKVELPKDLQARFETREVSENDAHLKAREVDAVLVVNTYMYIDNRIEYLKRLKQGITKGGSIIIVDYKDKNLPVGPPSETKVGLHTVETELKAAGYRVVIADDNTLEYQYIVKAVVNE